MLSAPVPVLIRIKIYANESTFVAKCVIALEKLQSVVGFTYWWPDSAVCGVKSTGFVTRPLQH